MSKNRPTHDVFSDTWVATDGLGRELPGFEQCGPLRTDRFVGIFYFICNLYRGKEGPYDVTKTIAANPASPAFMPGKPYYWGEPEAGYYTSTDRWVIRRHAYQLADAGIDTLIFDVTNDATFPESYRAVCEVFEQVRAEGELTPDICFLASERAIHQLWADFYQPGDHKDLWFQWKGKPLLIFGQWEKRGDMNKVVLPDHIQEFFTIRKSWAWDSLPWYGEGGRHRWPWVAHFPQPIGWDLPGVAEMVPVAVGQHPLSNIGRSFHNGRQPETNEFDLTAYTDLGLHFEEQWQRALQVDPEFVFVTGWNEWTAGCVECEDPSQEALQAKWDFFPGAVLGRAGKILKKGDLYFIDQYNQEYSRDAEPMKGGHTDNYYYQLVANVRRFKGVRAMERSNGPHSIDINGGFEQWEAVKPEYRDHLYDTLPRDEPGFGAAGRQRHTSGRNEIVRCKVAADADHLYFYVETREKLSEPTGKSWMMLFLNTDQKHDTGWLGYDFLLNAPVIDASRTTVKKNTGGWDWRTIGEAHYHTGERQLMLAIPRRMIGLQASPLRIDFHWLDNAQEPGDLENFLTQGDSAPPRCFDYRFEE